MCFMYGLGANKPCSNRLKPLKPRGLVAPINSHSVMMLPQMLWKHVGFGFTIMDSEISKIYINKVS